MAWRRPTAGWSRQRARPRHVARSRAAASRARVRSLPSWASDSHSGGPTARPVVATRTGPCVFASRGRPSSLTNPSSTVAPTTAASTDSGDHDASVDRLQAPQRLVEHRHAGRATHHVLVPGGLVDVELVLVQERDHRIDLGERLHPLLHQWAERAQRVDGGVAARKEGRRLFDELVDRERPQVLGVDVGQLLDVEERRRRVHVGQLEALDDLRDGTHLDAIGWAPPQQREVVDHRLGQVAAVAVVADRHVVTSLGELLALLVDQQRQVGEHRG